MPNEGNVGCCSTRPRLTLAKRYRLLVSIGVAIVTLAVAAYHSGIHWQRDPPLSVPRSSLWFGSAWEQESFRYSVPITNTWDRTIEIVGFKTSCGQCSSIHPESLNLSPGETQIVEVCLNLDRPPNTTATLSARHFRMSMIPRIADYFGRPQVFSIGGRVKPLISQNGQSYSFDNEIVVGTQTPPLTIPVHTAPEVGDMSVSCDCAFFEVSLKQEGNSHYLLQVDPRPTTELGAFLARITLRPRGSEDRMLPESTFAVKGKVVGDVVITPFPLVFGSHVVGESIKSDASIRSLSGHAFRIAGMLTARQYGLTADFSAKSDRPWHGIEFTQEIAHPGTMEYQVVLQVVKAGGVSEEVPLRVCYYGIEYQE